MEVEPFKNILTDYNQKVEFNIQGMEGVKHDLVGIKPYIVDINEQLQPCNGIVSGTLS
jgi:hypothetical protein